MRICVPRFFAAFVLPILLASAARPQALAAASPKAAKYEEIAVANGGRISGRVTFKGPAPVLKLAVTQDKPHCSHSNGMAASPRLKVDPTGGVAEAVVYLKNIAQGKPLASLVCAKTLDQVGCSYAPFVQVAPFKEMLTIVNSDPLNHNVNGKIGASTLFNLAMPNTDFPNKKQTIPRRLTTPGIITIQCDVHAWMSAYVWVVRHPYYAVTAQDGCFELTDIPPGEYEVGLWHPGWDAKLGANGRYEYGDPIEKTAKVVVSSGGDKKIDFVLNDK